MRFDAVYYEPGALEYALGRELREKFGSLPWNPVGSHNKIDELRRRENRDFPRLKRLLVVGVRKSLRYVPNDKSSDFLVPYTSSGCPAMCLYCYLVCNYNKCAYLRLFVNREQMLEKLLKTAAEAAGDKIFEIGSNSDLVLENGVTGNLCRTVERFGRAERGFITLPTKFSAVAPLLPLCHRGRTIFRMSVNPPEIIRRVELGTSPLDERMRALNDMAEAGYPVGLLIAPVILTDGWREEYGGLLDRLEAGLSDKVKKAVKIEVIFMTYSFIHRAINREAFPHAPDLYDPARMTGRGRGKYCYGPAAREEAEPFLRDGIEKRFGPGKILYIV